MLAAFAFTMSEEEDGGGPAVGLVVFEFEYSNGGSLGSEGSAAKLTLLSIPSFEVEEVWQGDPVART